MRFGQALEQTIDEHGETQEGPARVAHVSGSYISKIIRGSRRPPKDVMRSTTAHYDEPQLCLAAQEEVVGPACVPWLDNADLHPANVHLKAREEVWEAYEALETLPVTKRNDQLSEKDFQNIRRVIKECIEAITALTHQVAILCKQYAVSWVGMWKEHRTELRSKKYLH